MSLSEFSLGDLLLGELFWFDLGYDKFDLAVFDDCVRFYCSFYAYCFAEFSVLDDRVRLEWLFGSSGESFIRFDGLFGGGWAALAILSFISSGAIDILLSPAIDPR